MKPLSRREFFRTTGFVALGAFAASCTKKLKVSTGKTLASITSGHQQTLQMNTAGFEILSGTPDRLVFNLIEPSNGSAVTISTVQLYIAPDEKSAATPLTAMYRVAGLPADKGFYEARTTMPKDGTWLAVVIARDAGRTDYASGQFQVGRQTAMPKAGDHAVSVPTPTYQDHRGVNPICTRTPPCSMHAISLDAALKNGKPTVLIISTPKFCTSALCGPETDVVQSVSKSLGARMNFIHVEVYKDDKATTVQQQILSPGAAAWRLAAEPAIYYIDKNGIIAARTIGPSDTDEVRAFAQSLTA
ncbi:MAG TPA: hypothetical protein VJ818_01815 [Actinomycetota bacterium]|nr:hypothetical protein [Actinomycetota bacterium]